ncbi:MAG: response regulator [Thermodesulfobacteriota bacterium]
MVAPDQTVPWYRSLLFKLVAAAITVEFIMLSVLLANSFRLLHHAVESQAQTRLEALSPLLDAALAGRVFQFDHAEVAAILERLTSTEHTEINYLTVFDQFGTVIASAGTLASAGSLPAEDHSVLEALSDLSYDIRLPLTIIDTEVGTVCFGLSLASMVDTKNNVIREGIIIAGAEIFLSLLLLASGGYLITRHIRLLAKGSRQIASGDYSARIAVSGHDEIAMLAHDFNGMTQAISRNIQDLRASEMRTQAIFNSVGEAIFIHDAASGKILDVNQRMCEMYSCTRTEALGSEVGTFSSGVKPYTTQGALKKIRAAMAGTPQTFEWQARSLAGRIFWVEVSLRLAKIGDDDRLIAVSRDISARKQDEDEKEVLEKKLHQSQRLESIGLLAGGVAHDLNNILSGVVGYPELILHKLPEESEIRGQIEAINESGKRAATVVADLLTVARGAASPRESYNMNRLVEEYCKSPEHIKLRSLHPQIKCQYHLEARSANVLCSPVHVKKCLMNLVTNATESIDGPGKVEVITENHRIDEREGDKYDIVAGDYLVINVQDDGSGISKDDLEHIFDPFYSKKVMGRSGTGLGLTVVWNTMEDHNGKVTVESSEDGTCFHLYFPLSREKERVKVETGDAPVSRGNNEYILVVEDEPLLQDIANHMLTALGYRVDVVPSGEEAIEFVKEHRVDLLVIDMMMEPGINGRQTYEEIIKLYPDQKALITSGYSESDDIKAAIELGAGGFIKKPYSIDQLGQAVKAVLDEI